MAKGIENILNVVNANSKSFDDTPFAREIWPHLRDDGSSVTVSFLENSDEFQGAYFHMYQPPKTKIWLRAACLDQYGEDPMSCPACAMNVSKTFKGFLNVVLFDAPIYKKDEDGKLEKDANGEYIETGTGDVNAIWVQGVTVLKTLTALDLNMKGIAGKTFTIVRQGKGKTTTYTVIPSGEVKLFSDELVENKYDLDEFIKPLSPDNMTSIFQKSPESVALASNEAREVTGNPLFTRKANRFS